MTVSYNGLDCLADTDLPQYMAYKTESQAQVPWTDQPKYGYYTIYFGCTFIGLALIKHIYYKVRDSRYKGSKSGGASFIDVIVSYGRFFGYKQLPASISYHCSLPTSLGSSLFLFASTLYLCLYCFVPHFWLRGCRGFGSPPLAVRAGIMATALTPFVYILAGKANFITFVTGISYEKLNYIHQYVGVAALVLSLVHTIPFISQPLAEGGYQNLKVSFNDFYYISGLPPLVLLILLCTLSNSSIRKLCYEGFWHLHWVMGVAYFATLTWHVFGMLGTTNYMWSALGFWGAQVLYRVLVKTSFKPNSLFLRPSEAKVFKLQGSTGYQVDVKNRYIKWKPGQHVYLRFKSRLLDNHPFSVSNLPDETGQELKFVIVPKSGFTKVLYDKIDSVLSEKVYLDGPYGGCSRDHNTFDNVYLLASGSGITATISFLTDLSERIRYGKNTITKKVHFVWIVRKAEDIDWFKQELEKAAQCPAVSITIYVASGSTGTITEKSPFLDSSLEEAIETKSTTSLDVSHEKPNVSRIISSFKYTLGRKNFFVCSGSDSMKMQVSSAVSFLQPLIFNSDIQNYMIDEIYLHTESFGW